MKPLQVYLDDAEVKRLETWSRERGWTKSQAIRAALRALTRPRTTDPLLSARGFIIDGLSADASVQFDHLLQETFVAKKSSRGSRAPRVRR